MDPNRSSSGATNAPPVGSFASVGLVISGCGVAADADLLPNEEGQVITAARIFQ